LARADAAAAAAAAAIAEGDRLNERRAHRLSAAVAARDDDVRYLRFVNSTLLRGSGWCE
jgi:hypothetical protein